MLPAPFLALERRVSKAFTLHFVCFLFSAPDDAGLTQQNAAELRNSGGIGQTAQARTRSCGGVFKFWFDFRQLAGILADRVRFLARIAGEALGYR